MHPLRDYQIDIIQRIEAAISNGYRRIMLQLPTGAGKTRCFVELAKRHSNNPYLLGIPNCLIVAHRKELIDQAVNALSIELGSKRNIGVIKANVDEHRHRAIQVASIQSLIRRTFPEAGLVIIDEAHHATAKTYQTIINHYENAVILGVTATPARTDGKGFRDSFEILIEGPTVKKLTAQEHLCPYKLYAYVRQKINTSSVKTQAGDYILNQLADAVIDSEVRADLVKTWEKHALGKRTVVFAVNIELSKEYAEIYNASGYKAEHVDGKTPERERTEIFKRFKSGETKILCNCNIVTEGFDLPEMECVQIVRPTKSLVFWLQMVGRSLRTSQEKSIAIILDHTDNYKRLGLPDDVQEWTLDGVDVSKFTSKDASEEISLDEREKRIREIQHLEGDLIEIYSNSVESSLQEPEDTTAILRAKQEEINTYTEAIRLNPDDADIYNSRALVKSDLGDKQGAIADYTEAIRLNPDYDPAYFNRGIAKANLGDNYGAIADFTESIRLDPDYADTHKLRAKVKADLGDNYGAIADYTEAIRLVPEDAIIFCNRGRTNANLGYNYSAIKDFTESIRLNPDNNVAFFYRGKSEANLGDKYNAIADFTEYIRIDPNFAYTYELRAQAKADLGDNYGAIADFTEAICLNPNYADANYRRGLSKKALGDNYGAIADFTEAIRLNPNYADANYMRGLVKNDLGDNQGAITDFTEAIRLNPDCAGAFCNRGVAKYDLGDVYGAIADYTEAIRIHPDDAQSNYRMGEAMFNLGHKSGAIADFTKAIRLDPDFDLAYLNRAFAKNDLGDKYGAIADFTESIRLDPNYADTYINRGVAKKDLGDKQGALTDFKKAAQLFQEQCNTDRYQKVLKYIDDIEKSI